MGPHQGCLQTGINLGTVKWRGSQNLFISSIQELSIYDNQSKIKEKEKKQTKDGQRQERWGYFSTFLYLIPTNAYDIPALFIVQYKQEITEPTK
jgi:hypothetical protein